MVGVTKIKTPTARERDRPDVVLKRDEYRDAQPLLDAKRLIFLDESGMRLGATPRYGWAPVGEKAPGLINGCWKSITMIGAVALDGFRGFMTVNSGTNKDVFKAYVEQQLIPNLKVDDIVIMDNLSVHKMAEIVTLIKDAGADVLFLPPYSPEFNPIEKVWAKMKDIIRKMDTMNRENFDKAVAKAMDAITAEDIRAWTLHAGYTIN